VTRDGREPATHLETVGSVVEALTGLGLEPILVGGWAWWCSGRGE